MVHASLKKTLYEVVYGHPIVNSIAQSLKTSIGNYDSDQVAKVLDQILHQIREEIQKEQMKQVWEADKHHQNSAIKERDRVYLKI